MEIKITPFIVIINESTLEMFKTYKGLPPIYAN